MYPGCPNNFQKNILSNRFPHLVSLVCFLKPLLSPSLLSLWDTHGIGGPFPKMRTDKFRLFSLCPHYAIIGGMKRAVSVAPPPEFQRPPLTLALGPAGAGKTRFALERF